MSDAKRLGMMSATICARGRIPGLLLLLVVSCGDAPRSAVRTPRSTADAGASDVVLGDGHVADLVSRDAAAEDVDLPDAGAADVSLRDAALPDLGARPTGTPGPNEVILNDTMLHQTLDGVGANVYAFPFVSDLGWRWESVRSVFDDLDLHYVRVASWFEWWETRNDDGDPTRIEPSGFQTTHRIIDDHDVPFARWLDARGIEVSLGVWNVADWLASGRPRRIPPSMYPELGESIAAYLLHLRAAGITIPVTEVQNEPAIEASINYPSPEALRDAALAVLDQLDRHGLSQVALHGPNHHQPRDTVRWARVWLAEPRLARRTAALSFHTWWDEDFATFDEIRRLAEQHQKPVWATEMGYCALPAGCFGGTHFLRPETWETAWDFALSYYRAIAWARASRLYHWTVVGHDALVSPTGARTPTFHLVRHFTRSIAPGSALIDGASGDPTVLALGFAQPGGARSAILFNTGRATRTVRVRSARGDALAASGGLTSTRGSVDGAAAITQAGGALEVVLPAESVTSFAY